MNSVLVKSLLSVGAAGAVGGGGYGIYYVSSRDSSQTIRQILEADGNYIVLDVDGNTSDSIWEEKIKLLNDGNDKSLEGYTKSSANGENEQKQENLKSIKGICKNLFDSKETSKLVIAKEWCVNIKTKAAS